MQDRLFGIGLFRIVCVTFVLLLIANQPVGQFALRLRRTTFDDGPIGFLDGAGPEHAVQASQSLTGLGEEDDAADGTIQSVCNANENIAGLIILLLQPDFQGFGQGLVPCLISLYDLAAAFVDCDEVIILVNDFHITCSCRHPPGSLGRKHMTTSLKPGMSRH